jgi:hypothetical protein
MYCMYTQEVMLHVTYIITLEVIDAKRCRISVCVCVYSIYIYYIKGACVYIVCISTYTKGVYTRLKQSGAASSHEGVLGYMSTLCSRYTYYRYTHTFYIVHKLTKVVPHRAIGCAWVRKKIIGKKNKKKKEKKAWKWQEFSGKRSSELCLTF